MNVKPIFNLLKAIFILLLALLIFFPSQNVYAHALQPAFLNLHEQETGQFQVLWKVPYLAEGSTIPLAEKPQLPDTCQPITPQITTNSSGSVITHVTINCGEKGLYGQNITILGLTTALNDVLLRIETLAGKTYSGVLRANNPSYHIPPQGARSQIAWSYLTLGIKHILTGYDHLLFVLGLVLLVQRKWLLS